MSTFSIQDLSPSKTNTLRSEVRTKLTELDSFADDSLTDYVLVLLANRHGREKVISDLEDFLSPMVVESFVDWLFAKFSEIKNVQEPTPMVAMENKTENKPNSRLFTQALKGISTEPTPNNIGNNNNSNDIQDIDERERILKARAARFGIVRDRSKSPERRSRKPTKSPMRRATSRSPIRYRSINSRIDSELNESVNNRRIPKRKVTRKKYEGDREFIIQDPRDLLSRKSHFERFSPERKDELDKRDTFKTDMETSANDDKKVKCSFWPNCKSGEDCPYVHPSEPCRHFPSCVFGEKCLFIHPSIPCKFQGRCQNPNCNYQHSSPAQMAPQPAVFSTYSTTNDPYQPPSAIPCRFFPNCKNVNCPFMHPNSTPCKFGENCQRPACPFVHPQGRILQQKAFVNAPCRYGRNCAKPDCPFQHASSPSADLSQDNSIAMSMESIPVAENSIPQNT